MKNHKIVVGIIFFMALVTYVFGEGVFLLCRSHIYLWACNEFLLQVRGWFVLLSVPFLITTPILFFVRRETFVAWAKFAAVGFPIMFGVLLYAFNIKHWPGGWVRGPNEAELASIILPPIFILLSFGIIMRMSAKPKAHMGQSTRSIIKFIGGVLLAIPALFSIAFFLWFLTSLT